MFDRIFGWFKKLGNEPAAEPVPETKPRERPSARPERRERKSPSSRRPDNRNEPREAREQRSEHDKETAKPPRPPRQPKPRAEKPVATEARPVVDAVDSQPPTEAREPRSRRGRGGRGRNREDRPQQAALVEATAETTVADHAAPRQYGAVIESAQASKAPAPVEVPAAPAPVAQQSLVLETRPVNAANTPEAVLASSAAGDRGLQQVETQAVSAVENSDPSRSVRPRRRRPSSAPSASETLLQQVETAPVPVVTASEPAGAAPHPTRRRQRPPTPVSDEPLIQVETGNPQ
jgi:ribonuclease E